MPQLQCRMSEADVDANYLPIDPFDALQCYNIYGCFQVFMDFFMDWYENACIVTWAAMSDIKTLWIVTNGNYMHKGKMVTELFANYLIVFTIYVIETTFWIDKKIIEIISNAVLDSQLCTQVVMVLGVIWCFVLAAFHFNMTFMSL